MDAERDALFRESLIEMYRGLPIRRAAVPGAGFVTAHYWISIDPADPWPALEQGGETTDIWSQKRFATQSEADAWLVAAPHREVDSGLARKRRLADPSAGQGL